VLLNRHGSSRLSTIPLEGDDPEAYQKTMAALTAEDVGDVAGARATWAELVRTYEGDASAVKVMWALHAQKKLNDLTASEREIAALVAKIDEQFRLEDKDIRFDSDLDQRIVTAIRLDQFKDFSLAHDRWAQIAETVKGDQDRRRLFVYA